MKNSPSIGEYLIQRLYGHGVRHVFGIPGDYVLGFYDLLFVGVESMRTKSGGFNPEVTGIAMAFDGPTALVIGHDSHLEDPQQCPMNILVPVAGTDVSRRAAE